MSEAEPALLGARAIDKSFAGVHALRGVSLHVQAGEVLGVIGENGAGKSTLMKILAGVQQADAGQITFAGKPLTLRSVQDAIDAGIVLIHQELNLAGNLDIGANIRLGQEPRRFGMIDHRAIRRDARAQLAKVGLDVDPDRRVDELPIGKRQLVEIAKALSVDARVLIMDEPTSSLSVTETRRLFEVITSLKQRGVGIIYISHRLAEVEAIADRVIVLRDGRRAGELARDEIDHDAMVRLMIGRDLDRFYARSPVTPGDVVLEVDQLRIDHAPQHALSLSVRAGEIVGLAGLVGAGRTELLEAIFGLRRSVAGSVNVGGRPASITTPIDGVRAGLALVPEDRQTHGLLLEDPVRDNLTLCELGRRGAWRRSGAERALAASLIRQLAIRTDGDTQIANTLSGGNQQKLVVGKWLAVAPRVLLLDEPTRGVDIGAKAEIYRIMEQLVAEGLGILFASSDLEEVLGMADRVIVMRQGAITGELSRDDLTEESIMQLATREGAAA